MESGSVQLIPGSVLGGRYRLERLIGEGGMGKVFLARDTVLSNGVVAIKFLHGEICHDERHRERFLREVQLNRLLNHPNVVRTFDLGQERETLFMTMEYVDGMTLKTRLHDSGSLEPGEVIYILKEICKGLSAVHSQKITHRDLKPGNVLIGKNEEVKISDFGVARPGASDLTQHDEIIGCAPYIAPEVWMGRQAGVHSDIYALGIIAFEMLTGSLPFDGESPAELMRKHLDFKPFPIEEISEESPVWLNDLVHLMLEKSPSNRPRNTDEILSALESGPARNFENLRGNNQLSRALSPELLEQFMSMDIRSSVSKEKEPSTAINSRSEPSEPPALQNEIKDSYLARLDRPGVEEECLSNFLDPLTTESPETPSSALFKESYSKTIGSFVQNKHQQRLEELAPANERWLRKLLLGAIQTALLLTLSAGLLYLLQYTLAEKVPGFLIRGADDSVKLSHAVISSFLTLVLCLSILALPFTLLPTLFEIRSLRFRGWRQAMIQSTTVFCIAGSALWSYYLIRVALVSPKESYFNNELLGTITGAVVQTMTEAAMLFPVGTIFVANNQERILVSAPASNGWDMVPYYLCLALVAFVFLRVLKCAAFQNRDTHRARAVTSCFSILILLVVIESVFRSTLEAYTGKLSLPIEQLTIGSIQFVPDPDSLALGLVNWTIMTVTLVGIVLFTRNEEDPNNPHADRSTGKFR